MTRTLVSDTPKEIGKSVLLQGWVNTRRDHGKIVFIDLRDRTGLVQVVLDGQQAGKIGPEDVISVTGKVVARPEKLVNPKLATGTIEISAQKIEVLSAAVSLPFDISKEDLDLELPTLLDYRGLTLRHPKVKAIFKVQEVIIDAFRRALKARDFMEFQSPSLIPAVPEGGAEVFTVKYFTYQAFLSQSPQLYKSLLVSIFERVFTVNQVFRAEPSVTTDHIAEYTSLDAEFGFINSWTDVVDMTEYVVKYILREVGDKCAPELTMFQAVIPEVPDKIPIIKMRDAQQIIFERTGRDVRQEKDPSPEDEREICAWAKETHHSDLVFVSHYMTKYRPFYTYPDNDNPEFNQGFDLLGRGREWLTGGRRIHDYKMLLNHAREWGVDPKDIEIYLQGFRYGMPPLGGFAFGAERLTKFILGLPNIRQASMFPRDMERVDIRFSRTEK